MDKEQQVKIMETQLSNFDGLLEKMQYMSMMFDPDSTFTQEARDIVRGNISREIKSSSYLQCNECDRKSWDSRIGHTCLMTQPSGQLCMGIFQ